MSKSFTLGAFLKKYKTDRDCLIEVVNIRFPEGVSCKKCKGITKHYLLKTRPVLSCSKCQSQISPLKGTIFEKTTTPLKLWFYAMFLMIHSKGGISAKNIQRQTGISYETAWRMLHQIRRLMATNSGSENLLSGTVEVDETYIGGKSWFRGKKWWSSWKDGPRVAVMGFVERGGRVKTTIIPDDSRYTLTNQVKANIDRSAWVVTDKHFGYSYLDRDGYKHDSVNHSIHYVDYDNNEIHTNTIEGFWSQLKRGIVGTYRKVSPKYLQAYCNEFGFRYSHRNEDIFGILLEKINN